MPFDVSLDDGILTLTLDTPKSPINIFNHATAHQLVEILSGVTRRTTRAVVFTTAKPNSFINGVGLLLAQTSQTYEDVVRASTPPWEAYQAVSAVPVPTIAAVHGNCFGCGVEFALHCDYRIATDSCETQFYMTELHDYLFIPLFGGTWNLPEAVGLADAVELLLWGERWSATTAYERGLVDEVVPHAERAERTQTFLRRVLVGEQTSRRRGRVRWGGEEDATVARTRRRITALPPQYHTVYTAGLELLIDGARQTRTYAEHQREELRHSAASALSPIGKSAFGFFYLRQMAGERAAGRFANGATPATLCFDVGDDADARVFAEDLCGRRLAGMRDGGSHADFRMARGLSPQGTVPFSTRDDSAADLVRRGRSLFGESKRGQGTDRENFSAVGKVAVKGAVPLPPRGTVPVFVRASFADMPPADAVLYAPTYRAGGRLIELAIQHAGMDADEAARLARTLQRLGFEVARTTPVGGFVSNLLLMAFFSPLVSFVANGGEVATVNGALRAAGFVRRPHQLLAALDRPAFTTALAKTTGIETAALSALLATVESDAYDDGVAGSTVIDAVCISMLDAILALHAGREVRDLSIADLIARELLDFPRHLCSLCSWLKRHRVAQAVSGGSLVRSIVSERAFETARTFAAEGRELYR